MQNTYQIITYIIAHCDGKTGIVNVPFDDPILLQAELDGYADRVGHQWIARDHITPGEQRALRYIFGGIETITGD